ncbi:MAG: ester cyclase [Anaerolineae bacterium]|nr:ester cyclase [Anaerolineae bacterium]
MKARFVLFTRMILLPVLLLSVGLPVDAQPIAETNKAAVTRYTEQVWNANNPDGMAGLFADNFQLHDAAETLARNGQTLANAIRYWHTPPFDINITDYTLLAQDDLIAQVYTFGGVHQDRPFGLPKIDIFRLERNKITDMWASWDYQSFGLQEPPKGAGIGLNEWFPRVGTSTTTPQDNIALVERAIALWNTEDTQTLGEVYAADLVFHLPLRVRIEPLDLAGVRQYIHYLHTVMPDFRIETSGHPRVAEGDLVAYHDAWSGTYTSATEGSFPILAEGADLYRIKDGKIAEVWWNWQSRSVFRLAWFAPQVQGS